MIAFKKRMLFLLFSAYLFIFCPLSSFSEENTDSIAPSIEKEESRFSFKRLILPASLITIASLGIENGYVKSLNQDVKREVAGFRSSYFHADDYLQYLPAVSVFGLSLVGAKPKHDYYDRSLIVATAYLAEVALVNCVKYTVRSPRPDNPSVRNSFPSGHTATVFVGAEIVRQEYWDDSPWYGIAAYSVATGVGLLRIYNERHWTTDVIAGAGFGILGARIGYWLLPVNKRLFHFNNDKQLTFVPYYIKQQGGLSLSYRF